MDMPAVTAGTKITVSTDGLPDGPYLIKFQMENGHTWISKIVIHH